MNAYAVSRILKENFVERSYDILKMLRNTHQRAEHEAHY